MAYYKRTREDYIEEEQEQKYAMSKLMKGINENKAHRINYCGADNNWKCKEKWCPVCSRIKNLKDSNYIHGIFKTAVETRNQRFLYLTFTVKACESYELRDTIEQMKKAINKVLGKSKFKKICKGTIARLHIAFEEKDNTFTPHIHMLILTAKSYETDTRRKLKKSYWVEEYREALGELEGNIEFRKIDYENPNTAKRLTDYISNSKLYEYSMIEQPALLQAAMNGTYKMRHISYTGECREIKKLIESNSKLMKEAKEMTRINLEIVMNNVA